MSLSLVGGCRLYSVTNGSPKLEWVDSSADWGTLPSFIRVYSGSDDDYPLRAFYARIETNDSLFMAHFIVADDDDGRDTATHLARMERACVLINGGFFFVKNGVGKHIGLRVSGGRLVQRATPGIIVNSVRYRSARAALGFSQDGKPSIEWVSSRQDSIFAWDHPPSNKPGIPAPPGDEGRTSLWSPWEALAAGPMLIRNGVKSVTSDEEVFFGTAIPRVHPRSAVGVTETGDLLLLVVDGRQADSRGVDLDHLATILLNLGAVDAMNLDGGGSSELIVNGTLINTPIGARSEREIVSALAVGCGLN